MMKSKLGWIIVSPITNTPQEIYNNGNSSTGTSDIDKVTFFNTDTEAFIALRHLEAINRIGRSVRRAEITLNILEG